MPPPPLCGGGGVTSKDCCQIEISRHSINELPFWGSFNNIDTKKSFICLYVLTALARAILRIGLSPSFSIFFITGTYAIGITSTGIPFLNWNVKRHWHSILNVLWIQYCTFIYQTVYTDCLSLSLPIWHLFINSFFEQFLIPCIYQIKKLS